MLEVGRTRVSDKEHWHSACHLRYEAEVEVKEAVKADEWERNNSTTNQPITRVFVIWLCLCCVQRSP
jgi:hypothetical protein